MLEIVERNAHVRPRQALFEIGPVFLGSEEGVLPDEVLKLVIVLTGPRSLATWQTADQLPMDFFDLKGVLAALFEDLHLHDVSYEPCEHPSFHPGKCARVLLGDRQAGVFGELHPLLHERYDFPETPVIAAAMELQVILDRVPEKHYLSDVPSFPPVLEDLAFVLTEDIPAERVRQLIFESGKPLVAEVRLFDLYRGEQIGEGKKSLAYSIVYQAPDRTLTDDEVAKVRGRIIRQLDTELGAKLRS
jgi:phenylalanyl-tRNA synthetase beta chain